MAYPIHSRKSWNAESPAAPMQRQTNFNNGGYVHWTDGPTKGVETFSEQARALRGIQSFHIHNRGWSDIGYHFVIFQPTRRFGRARIFRARQSYYVPAAQEGSNTGTLAVAVFMAPGDKLANSTKLALLWIFARHGIGRKQIRCHSDAVATDCPGPILRRWVRGL